MHDHGAPIGQTDVTRVTGEQPEVAGKILDAISAFALFGNVQVFDDGRVHGFRVLVMGVGIFHEGGEALRGGAETR